MIKLACEIPVRYLKMFSKMLDYDFVLAHLVEKSEEYKNFYKEQSASGRLLILDNSAFELENPIDGERLLSIAAEINPTYVVVPDKIHNGPDTMEKADDFVQLMQDKGVIVRLLAVAHGSTLAEWIECYNFLTAIPEIERIGIPFDIPFPVPGEAARKTQTQQWMERRIKLITHIHENGIVDAGREHHLMGASDCVEYRFLKKFPFVTTADTSSPVVHGMHGILYKDFGLPCEKIKEKIDFDAVLSKKQINDINKNIQVVRRFAK